MKARLLRKLRKRFDWKFVIKDDKKVMFIYDKKWNRVQKNPSMYLFDRTDLECLLEEFGNENLKNEYERKKMKLKFEKL